MTWQPIETAPKDGTRVLLYSMSDLIEIGSWVESFYREQEYVRTAKDGDVYRTVTYDHGYWDSDAYNPTHWMPLPAAPEVSND